MVWDLPAHSKRPVSKGLAPGSAASSLAGDLASDPDVNWLGQRTADFSFRRHAHEEGWRSPFKARQLGLLP